MALSERSPSSRVSLRRHAGPKRWPRGSFTACLMRRLKVCGGWWCPGWSAGSSSRRSPFCRPGALSCFSPLLAHHERGIPYRRGCEKLPFTTLKWTEGLPCFRRWCLLPWSRCLGACLMRPSEWKLLASWLSNSGGWRGCAHGLSGLTRRFATCSLDRHSFRPDGPTVWTKLLGGLGKASCTGGGRH
jgi:hypothetical protein